MLFYSFDLDPMTLILKPDLDMVKMDLHAKNEGPSYSCSNIIAWTDRQTHTHAKHTHAHKSTTHTRTHTPQNDTHIYTHTDSTESITYPHAYMCQL